MAQTLQMSPKAADKMSSLAATIHRLRAKQEEATARSVTSLEVAGVAGLIGFVEGRYDRTEIMGAPIAAVVGVVAHVAAYSIGGKDADHLHAVGDGALAVAAFNFAKSVGVDRKAKVDHPQQTAPVGYWPRAA